MNLINCTCGHTIEDHHEEPCQRSGCTEPLGEHCMYSGCSCREFTPNVSKKDEHLLDNEHWTNGERVLYPAGTICCDQHSQCGKSE